MEKQSFTLPQQAPLPLPQFKKRNGYLFEQVVRGARAVVYSGSQAEGILKYEVFLIRVAKEYHPTWGDVIPAHEYFPSDEAFGVTAWTWGIHTGGLEYAMRKFNELENETNKNQTI